MKPDPAYEGKYSKLLKKITLEEGRDKNCGIFLFGSWAAGKERFGSDYDIGIINMDETTFEKFRSRILDTVEESIIPWKVDIVNFDTVSDSFRETALKHINWWKHSEILNE